MAIGICPTYITAETASDPFAFDLSAIEKPKETWQWSGFVQSRTQKFMSRHGWLSKELLAHLELKGNHRQWRSFVSIDARHDRAKRSYRDAWQSELHEAYLLYDGEHADISIGKQRVAWGVADGVSTIDRLNAVDLRDPIGNARTASRRPSWLIRLEQNTVFGTLEAAWLPQGKDRTLPEFNSPWESPGLHSLRSQAQAGDIELSIADPKKSEGGLRYLYYGQGIDWSLAYFNGYSDGPVYSVREGNRITLMPRRSHTYNAAVAFGLARSTLRAEIAYTPDAMRENQRSRLWQAVAGWDRSFDDNLYANVQLFWNHHEIGGDEHGLTYAVSRPFFDDAVTAGLRGQFANDRQMALETYFDYDYDDQLKIGGKLVAFDGAKDSPLGTFRDNDYMEISLRWEF